jgi:hypothetical protein
MYEINFNISVGWSSSMAVAEKAVTLYKPAAKRRKPSYLTIDNVSASLIYSTVVCVMGSSN